MWERTGKGCNSINMTSGVCLDEETYAAYLRQNDRKLKEKKKKTQSGIFFAGETFCWNTASK